MQPEPRSILVINAAPFGRSVQMLPAMRTLRGAFPKSMITAAVSGGVGELLAAYGLADELIDLGYISAVSRGYGNSLFRLARLVRRTRRRDYDWVLDFAPSLDTQVLARIGLRARSVIPVGVASLFDSLVGRGRQVPDPSDDCAQVLSRLGLSVTQPQLAIDLPQGEHEQFEQLLARNKYRGGEPVVVLHSAYFGDQHAWEAGDYAELAARLAVNLSARVIAADDPASEAFSRAVEAVLPSGAITMSKPRAMEFAAAIARASVVITDDAGVARVALDLRTPVVELADRMTTEGQRGRHRLIYGASRKRIQTEEVYEAACEIIQAGRTISLFSR